jgi:cytochrome c peroxidase
MKKGRGILQSRVSKAAYAAVAVMGLGCTGSLMSGEPQLALAQNASQDGREVPRFAPGAIQHTKEMRRFRDPDRGAQRTPRTIPRFSVDDDPTGKIATFQPGGATITANNAFFQDIGTNGRMCFSCHQPQEGWGVSADGVNARFEETDGRDPIFRLVDGATCPTDKVANLEQRRRAYKLLTDFGLIRIGLPMPPESVLEFEVTEVDDPYNCTTNPETGLTSPTTGIVSVYRRPLPTANLGFLSAIMWDGREPSFASQAANATLIHAQADAPPTAEQVAQITAFQAGLFNAQVFDNKAKSLTDDGAKGGPVALSLELANFFIGINDPVGLNPRGIPFTSQIFDLYRPWLGVRGNDADEKQRRSIARGQAVFNDTVINIAGVSGLNDELNLPSIPGFCGTCHDTPQVGNHSVVAPLNIGIADGPATAQPALDISGLPVFTLTCKKGPLSGQVFTVTDPGRALISGRCKDIGRFKGPILRGLASRAPFFHNGSGTTLEDVVDFYDTRFAIGFTEQQKTDLVNFLNAL